MFKSVHPPYTHRIATSCLLAIPAAVIGISLLAFAIVLPHVVSAINQMCGPAANGNGILCFITEFFHQCLSTSFGFAFIASFLAFVAVLITVSNVESARLFNQPSRVVTNPAIAWLFVNMITGAVVLPLVLAAVIKRNKDGLHELRGRGEDGHGPSRSPLPRHGYPNLRSDQRKLRSRAEVNAIGFAVALGFVIPSILLLFHCTSVSVALWNLFPVYITIIRRLSLSALYRFGSSSMKDSFHVESSPVPRSWLYGIPVVLSTIAHLHLLYVVAFANGDFVITPALKLMLINFCAIMFCVAYWILIETSWRVLALVFACTLLAGPGTGVCIGWNLKEVRSSELTDESDPLLSGSDASAAV